MQILVLPFHPLSISQPFAVALFPISPIVVFVVRHFRGPTVSHLTKGPIPSLNCLESDLASQAIAAAEFAKMSDWAALPVSPQPADLKAVGRVLATSAPSPENVCQVDC